MQGERTTVSRPGPKSRSRRHTAFSSALTSCLFTTLLFTFIATATATAEPRVSGFAHPVESTGGHAAPWTPPRHEPGQSHTQKRSLKRAVMRAQRAGGAHYKGRWYTWQQLRYHADPSRSTKQHIAATSRDCTLRQPPQYVEPHIHAMTFNCGGLPAAALDEILLWIPPDLNVLFLQETHWKFSSQWTDAQSGWYFIHSGASKTDTHCGLMTLVRFPNLHSHHIRSREIIQGRVQHVRIELSQRTIDLLNVYQQAVSYSQAKQHYEKRARICNTVSDCIKNTPARNLLIMAGDFNTSLPRLEPMLGAGCKDLHREHHTKDSGLLIDVIRLHNLCALNTFHGRRKFTFYHDGHRTMIDYIFTRLSDARGQAKHARVLYDDKLMAWKTTRHYPISARIPQGRISWPPARIPIGYDVRNLQLSIIQNDTTAQSFRQEVTEQLSGCSLQDTITLTDVVRQACIKFYPEQEPTVTASIAAQLKGRIRNMWAQYKLSRGLQGDSTVSEHADEQWNLCREQVSPALQPGMRNVYNLLGVRCSLREMMFRWLQMARFTTSRKQTQQHGRQLRRQRYLSHLQKIADAEAARSQHDMYRVIRGIAPKQPRREVRVSNSTGRLLSKQEERAELKRHFQDVWTAAPTWVVPRLQTPYKMAPEALRGDNEHFSLQQFEHALARLPAYKAVPKTSLPSAIWKFLSQPLSLLLHRWHQDRWNTNLPQFPDEWAWTEVVLLVKPGKPIGPPSSLRPIGLIDPLSKAYVKVLADGFKPYALKFLEQIPQYAYLPGREISGCLYRAVSHCRKARDALKGMSYNLHTKRDGGRQHDFVCALQVSLDMSQAFDRAPWELIEMAVQRTGAPPSMCTAIMQWIQGTKYAIPYRGQSVCVEAGRGVRQGCVLSPVIWSVYTGLLFLEFQSMIMCQERLPDTSLYADDTHISWLLYKPEHVTLALGQLRLMLDLFRKFGLTVNPLKSQAILNIRGTGSARLRKTWTVDENNKRHLRLPGGLLQECIPLKSSIQYMAITLSYANFEMQTMIQRVGVAQASFNRLRKILHDRKVLTCSQRLYLWRSTVLPALQYGITCVGFTRQSAEKCHGLVMKHFRSISNLPRHITKVDNQALFRKLRVKSPLEALVQKLGAEKDRLQYKSEHDPLHVSDPCAMLASYAAAYRDLIQFQLAIDNCRHTRQHRSEHNQFMCTLCEVGFANQASLRQHMSKVHTGQKQELPSIANQRNTIMGSSLDGMPTCRWCMTKFTNWSGLTRHIVLRRCTSFPDQEHFTVEEAPPQHNPALATDSDFLDGFRRSGHQFLRKMPTHLKVLQHRCILCGQWLAKSSALKLHYRKQHATTWTDFGAQASKRVTGTLLSGPCPYCAQRCSPNTLHKCSVLLQVYLASAQYERRRIDQTPQRGGAEALPTDCDSAGHTDGNGDTGTEAHPGRNPRREGTDTEAASQSPTTTNRSEERRKQTWSWQRWTRIVKSTSSRNSYLLERSTRSHATSPGDGTPGSQTRGCLGSGKGEQRVPPIPATWRGPGGDCSFPISGEGEVAPGEGCRSTNSSQPPSSGHVQPHHTGTGDRMQQDDPDSGVSRASDSVEHPPNPRRRAFMALFGMGSSGTERTPIDTGAHAQFATGTPSRSHPGNQPRRHHSLLSRKTEAHGKDGGRDLSDATVSGNQRTNCAGSSPRSSRLMPPRSMEVDGGTSSSSTHPTRSTCQQADGIARRHTDRHTTDTVLSNVHIRWFPSDVEQDRPWLPYSLSNPDNRCYQNTVFLGLIWIHQCLCHSLPPVLSEFFMCGVKQPDVHA